MGDAGDASSTGLTKKILRPLNYDRRAQLVQPPAPAKRSNIDGKIDGTTPAEGAGVALF
jgi:hypothetical protein